MKRIIIYYILLYISSIAVFASEILDEYIELATFNIHYLTENDSISWNESANRKERVLNVISAYDFDLLGTQEVHKPQLDDLLTLGYADYGLGTNTGTRASGMRNAILYKPNRFTVLEQGTFWLSETPNQISKGWDAASYRNCSWLKLQDNRTSNIFFYFNTHFDHIGIEACTKSAKLIIDTIPIIAGDYPALFMGDLNSIESSEPIRILNQVLYDARELSLTEPQGPYGTGHGWRVNTNVRRIDYIYTYNGNGRKRIEVNEYQVIDTLINGQPPSDHWPVRIKIRFVEGEAVLRVTSQLDDGGDNTLRTILNSAKDGDSIYIDRTFVDTIRLNAPIAITKNLKIEGNGTVIQVSQPEISPFRVFTTGGSEMQSVNIRLSNMELRGGDLTGNNPQNANGGVLLLNENTVFEAVNLVFAKGKAVYGGGVFCAGTTGIYIDFQSCQFYDNSSLKNAGAFYSKAENCILNNCLFYDNSTDMNGSAVVNSLKINIFNTTFRNNSSSVTKTGAYGAAVFNTSGGIMLAENCTFDSNSSLFAGTGAFACSDRTSQSSFINCTFHGNKGTVSSAIYNRAGTINLIHCTITGNYVHAPANGALHAYEHANSENNIINSILAYNYNYTGQCDISAGLNALSDGTHNIIGATAGNLSYSNSLNFSYQQDVVNPLFLEYETLVFNQNTVKIPSLKHNGGTTKTVAIMENGIAYRSAATQYKNFTFPTKDQRNYTRYTNPCVGAFEVICPVVENLTVSNINEKDVFVEWSGDSPQYQFAYKASTDTSWKELSLTDNSVRIANLLPSMTYSWKVRSVCDLDYLGEWVNGNDFTTQFSREVTSEADDGGTETLRYIMEHAKRGDSITVFVDTIRLQREIEIKKNISINGQGAVIKPLIPGISEYRIFNIGSGFTTIDTIRLYNMNLMGGNLTSFSSTEGNGGAVFINKYTNLFMKNVTIENGKAVYGGAIHCNDSTGTRLTMDSCVFLNNEAINNAGAVYVKAIADINKCIFNGNKTFSNGSALTLTHNVKISNSAFTENESLGSGAYGGAVFATGGCISTFEACLFEDNRAYSFGAGAFGCSSGSTITTFTNCTFYANKGVAASALYNRAGKVNLINCTVTGNISFSSNKGAYYAYDASNALTCLVNNVFAYNYDSVSISDLWLSTANGVSGTNNIIGQVNNEIGLNLKDPITFHYDIFHENDTPLFSSYILQDGQRRLPLISKNGGFTKSVALSSNSIALKAGTPYYNGLNIPVEDQRAEKRNMIPCVGAYEFISEDTIVTDVLKNTYVRIVPNPATHQFSVTTVGSTLFLVEVYELSGKPVASYNSAFCNISFLNSGIYIVKTYTNNGTYFEKLIIK